MSLLANEFDFRSALHGQASLAAVNRIHVIHEAMKGCKKSKDSLKACFENEKYIIINTLKPVFFSKWPDQNGPVNENEKKIMTW